MSTVFVAVYEHRHGTDTMVFSTSEKAELWRQALASEYWGEEMDCDKPNDPVAAANEYFTAMSDRDSRSEYFLVRRCFIDGLYEVSP